jgi:hypothetical protein
MLGGCRGILWESLARGWEHLEKPVRFSSGRKVELPLRYGLASIKHLLWHQVSDLGELAAESTVDPLGSQTHTRPRTRRSLRHSVRGDGIDTVETIQEASATSYRNRALLSSRQNRRVKRIEP